MMNRRFFRRWASVLGLTFTLSHESLGQEGGVKKTGAAASWTARQAFEQFLQNTRSCQMDFTQTVTRPGSRSADAIKKPRQSRGQFAFIRPSAGHPGRFRFDYAQTGQVLVADGQIFRSYDPGLRQVVEQAQTQALSGTPVALIATATSVNALEKDFDIRPAQVLKPTEPLIKDPSNGRSPPMEWALEAVVKPIAQNAHSTVERMHLEWVGSRDGKQPELRRVQLTDRFGQISDLQLSHVDCQTPVPHARFMFEPPQGVEVVQANTLKSP